MEAHPGVAEAYTRAGGAHLAGEGGGRVYILVWSSVTCPNLGLLNHTTTEKQI
jgi:hypothetical protein